MVLVIMLNNIIDYLKDTIDEDVEIKDSANNKIIPIYLKEEFNFYQAKILDKKIIMIEPKSGYITLPTLEKRLESIKKYTDDNIVILYNSLTDYQRKKLINQRIAFIVLSRQMYLPFVALDLFESRKKGKKKLIKFSASAQLAYLYLLYNNRDITIEELSKIIKRTKMTASRALDELYETKLVTYTVKGKTGRQMYYRRIKDPQFFKIGYQYLKSPVVDKINIYAHANISGSLKAGLSALSDKSMISKPKHEIRAIGREIKNNLKSSLNSFIDNNNKYDKEPSVQIEVWAYDPAILSREEVVDIVSLKLSLANEKDERIQIEIENLMREFKWYMG